MKKDNSVFAFVIFDVESWSSDLVENGSGFAYEHNCNDIIAMLKNLEGRFLKNTKL